MPVRELTEAELPVAARIFETALGQDLAEEGRTAWAGYLAGSRTLGAFVDDRMVATAADWSGELTTPGGQTVTVQAVTGVGVLPTHTRRGLARTLMDHQFALAAEAGAAALVLEASEATIYGRFGYGPASTHTNAAVATRYWQLREPLAGDGTFEFAEGAAISHYGQPLFEAWRGNQPGQVSRPAHLWELLIADPAAWRDGGGELQWVFHVAADGTPDGYVSYRIYADWEGSVSTSKAKVLEIVASDPKVRLLLLDFVARIDLVAEVTIIGHATADGAEHRLVDPRRLRILNTRDGLWVRIVDVPAALGARRWFSDDTLVLDVVDPLVPAVAGRWRLEVTAGQAQVTRTEDPAELTLGVAELGMLWLGGHAPTTLARAGRLQAVDEVLVRATNLFRGIVAPHHFGEF